MTSMLAPIPKLMLKKPIESDDCEVHTFYEPYSFASMVKVLATNAISMKVIKYGNLILYYIEYRKAVVYTIDIINSTYPAIIYEIRIKK